MTVHPDVNFHCYDHWALNNIIFKVRKSWNQRIVDQIQVKICGSRHDKSMTTIYFHHKSEPKDLHEYKLGQLLVVSFDWIMTKSPVASNRRNEKCMNQEPKLAFSFNVSFSPVPISYRRDNLWGWASVIHAWWGARGEWSGHGCWDREWTWLWLESRNQVLNDITQSSIDPWHREWKMIAERCFTSAVLTFYLLETEKLEYKLWPEFLRCEKLIWNDWTRFFVHRARPSSVISTPLMWFLWLHQTSLNLHGGRHACIIEQAISTPWSKCFLAMHAYYGACPSSWVPQLWKPTSLPLLPGTKQYIIGTSV